MAYRPQSGVARLVAETYAMRLITLACLVIAAMLQARLIGPEGKGLLATTLSWSALIGGIALLGSDSAAIYFVARAANYALWLMRAGLIYAIGIAVIAGAPIGAAIAFTHQESTDLKVFLAITLLIPIFILTAILNAILIGLNRIRTTNNINAISSIIYVFTLSLCFLLHIETFESIVAIITGVQLTTLILLVAAVCHSGAAEYRMPEIPAFMRYALQSFRGNLAGLLFLRSSLLILGGFAPIAQAGIYSIALVFADVALMMPNTLTNILLPRLAGQNPALIAAHAATAARYASASMLALALMIGCGAFLMVPVGFGEAFRPAAPVALLLCIGAALGTPGMILSLYFNAREQPGTPATAAWIGCGVLIAGLSVLTPFAGAIGAAVANAVARLAMSLFIIVQFCRASGLNWRISLVFQATDWAKSERKIHALYEQIIHARRA
ncbi:MAG: lipopolysaccharide biosynthesis protein [Roseiflexus sp.]